MLIKALFQSKGGSRPRIFSPMSVLYLDDTGVLFASGIHALWAEGEWGRINTQLDLLAYEGFDYLKTDNVL